MAYQMMQNYAAAAQRGNYQNSLIGRNVKINRGGPDALSGRLLAARSNYLVLQTNTGVIYINAEHVKSISEAPGGTGGRSAMYIMADSFNGVLRQLRFQFVQINQGGPEKVTGFVADVSNDTLVLLSNKEAIRIPLFHIRSVSLAQQKGSKSGGNNNSTNSNSNSNNSNSNKSSGKNKSGGNRSQGNKGNKSQGGRTGGNRTGGAQGGNAVAQARAIRKSAAGSRRRSR